MPFEPGSQIGDYRILARLGSGAYGIVFEAEHVITRRIDALKLMLDSAGPEEDQQRFLREIQVQAGLQHPNIAAVYHAFRTAAGLVLVMERVPGESLRAVLDRGRLPFAEGRHYVLQMLAGLDYAERAGVIHRDIKPENILITPDGTVKLTDFGLAHVIDRARITSSNQSLGTPMYIAPEQVDGSGEVDARSDVYSTGVVLYEIATGQVPFPRKNGYAVMRAHVETPPAAPTTLDPAIGERLNEIILKAMEKDPARRFQSSAAFRDALGEAATLPPAVRPAASFMPRGIAAAIAAACAISCASLSAALWGLHQRPAVPVQARRYVKPPGPAVVPPPAGVAGSPTGAASSRVAAPAEAETSRSEPVHPGKTARVPARKAPRTVLSAAPISITPHETDADSLSGAEPATNPLPDPPAVDLQLSTAPAASASKASESVLNPVPASPDEIDPAPKKPNAVVRALRKIFRKRAAPPTEP